MYNFIFMFSFWFNFSLCLPEFVPCCFYFCCYCIPICTLVWMLGMSACECAYVRTHVWAYDVFLNVRLSFTSISFIVYLLNMNLFVSSTFKQSDRRTDWQTDRHMFKHICKQGPSFVLMPLGTVVGHLIGVLLKIN